MLAHQALRLWPASSTGLFGTGSVEDGRPAQRTSPHPGSKMFMPLLSSLRSMRSSDRLVFSSSCSCTQLLHVSKSGLKVVQARQHRCSSVLQMCSINDLDISFDTAIASGTVQACSWHEHGHLQGHTWDSSASLENWANLVRAEASQAAARPVTRPAPLANTGKSLGPAHAPGADLPAGGAGLSAGKQRTDPATPRRPPK